MNNFVLVINKEKDMTSREVVSKVSKIFNIKKMGHTGTLDPIAKGVLVIVSGKYTKLADLITSNEKEYIATIKLGIKTDTLDITGNIIESEETRKLDTLVIKEVLDSFKGKYEQTIPLYSAVHVAGKRLYEYARNNEEVVLPTKEVMIKRIEFISYEDETIKFRVLVSKGTYIRSLIQSICEKLKILGTMSELIRIKQGIFKIEDAYTLEDIKNNNYKLLKIEDILKVKVLEVDENNRKKIYNGNKLEDNIDGYVLYKENNEEIALYQFNNNEGRLVILLKDNLGNN